MMKVGMTGKIGLRRKEGLARYLSCLSYNHIHLSVSEHILFDAQVPALKPGSTKTRLWEQEEKMGIFGDFLEVTYQKSPKINPFLEGIIQKTENWHFGDHRIWGGGRYQSSIGICRGPTIMQNPVCLHDDCYTYPYHPLQLAQPPLLRSRSRH